MPLFLSSDISSEEKIDSLILQGLHQDIMNYHTGFHKGYDDGYELAKKGGSYGDLFKMKKATNLGIITGSTDITNVGYDKGLSDGYDIQKVKIKLKKITPEKPAFETEDHRGILNEDDSLALMGFVSNSTSEYNQYLPLFEESDKTIKISNPGNIAISEIYKKYKELELQSNSRTLS